MRPRLGFGRRVLPGLGVVAVAIALCPATVLADATDTLHRFIATHGSLFRNAVFDTVTPVLQRLVLQGTDLPPTATSLGFVYRYDVESGAMVREPGPLSSLFLDRPTTIGRHALAIGATYEHAHLTRYDGDDLADQLELRSSIAFADGSSVRRTLAFTELSVTADIVNLYATYGLGEAWDVNVLLPVVTTRLDLAAEQSTVVRDPNEPSRTTLERPSASDSAAGVGDLLLRSKWRLMSQPLELGLGLGIRAPTGSPGDFRGLGDWLVQPEIIVGRELGPHEIHGLLGATINADDLTRTRIRYGIGGSVQPVTGLAFFADILGSSGVAEDTFDIVSPNDALVRSAFMEQFLLGQPQPVPGGFGVAARVPRTDLVDVSIGIKWTPTAKLFVLAGALVPLTSDGFRAAVVPTVGAQWIF